MSVGEIRGRLSSSQAAPGFACHRAGHFGPDPLVSSGYKREAHGRYAT
jgi:hypothetical protein